MDVLSELRIEYDRLARHVDGLANAFDTSVARDLAVCLRNWVQMDQAIDSLAEGESWQLAFREGESWQLAFRHHSKPRELKRLRSRGNFVSIPLSGGAQAEGIAIAGVVVHDRALTAEEVKRSYELSKASFSQPTIMRLPDFFNGEGAEFKLKGVSKAVPRREFIDRCANPLGGAHPMSVTGARGDEHWADPYILEMYDVMIGPWPAPYAILMETGQQLRQTFGYVLDAASTDRACE